MVIGAEEGRDLQAGDRHVKALAVKYDQGPAQPAPTLQVRNIKLFLDGVITAPAFTGAMLAPYFDNTGTAAGAALGAQHQPRPGGVLPARDC